MLYYRQVPNLSQTNLNEIYASQTASIERGGHPDMEFLHEPQLGSSQVNAHPRAPCSPHVLGRPSVARPVFAVVFGPQTGAHKNHFFPFLEGAKSWENQ